MPQKKINPLKHKQKMRKHEKIFGSAAQFAELRFFWIWTAAGRDRGISGRCFRGRTCRISHFCTGCDRTAYRVVLWKKAETGFICLHRWYFVWHVSFVYVKWPEWVLLGGSHCSVVCVCLRYLCSLAWKMPESGQHQSLRGAVLDLRNIVFYSGLHGRKLQNS